MSLEQTPVEQAREALLAREAQEEAERAARRAEVEEGALRRKVQNEARRARQEKEDLENWREGVRTRLGWLVSGLWYIIIGAHIALIVWRLSS